MNEGICAVEGCGKSVLARGWCTKHYQRWSKYGDPLGSAPPRPRQRSSSPCTVDGCERTIVARSMCNTHYTLWWVKRRRDAWFAGKVCAHCGSADDLEVDHIDPATKDPTLNRAGGGSQLWHWPEARRVAELAKCQPLCHDCHRAKSAAEVSKDHGLGAYRSGRCRCPTCTDLNRVAQADWKATHRSATT